MLIPLPAVPNDGTPACPAVLTSSLPFGAVVPIPTLPEEVIRIASTALLKSKTIGAALSELEALILKSKGLS
jgi:hypothetical protein